MEVHSFDLHLVHCRHHRCVALSSTRRSVRRTGAILVDPGRKCAPECDLDPRAPLLSSPLREHDTQHRSTGRRVDNHEVRVHEPSTRSQRHCPHVVEHDNEDRQIPEARAHPRRSQGSEAQHDVGLAPREAPQRAAERDRLARRDVHTSQLGGRQALQRQVQRLQGLREGE